MLYVLLGRVMAFFRFMRPENLLSSLVAIYPPEGSNVERAGYLPGERAPVSEKSPQMVRLFNPSRLQILYEREPDLHPL